MFLRIATAGTLAVATPFGSPSKSVAQDRPPPPAVQYCTDGSVRLASEACPMTAAPAKQPETFVCSYPSEVIDKLYYEYTGRFAATGRAVKSAGSSVAVTVVQQSRIKQKPGRLFSGELETTVRLSYGANGLEGFFYEDRTMPSGRGAYDGLSIVIVAGGKPLLTVTDLSKLDSYHSFRLPMSVVPKLVAPFSILVKDKGEVISTARYAALEVPAIKARALALFRKRESDVLSQPYNPKDRCQRHDFFF